MTPYRRDIQARKNEVLRIAIEGYISTVTPVSSAWIAKQSSLDLSSATIRNTLAELEQEGYLTHPHTSAGRVPTDEGYRYYVDHFLHEILLLEEEKQRIKAEYNREALKLEMLLETTSKVLAETTHYTSIVSVDGWDNKLFCSGTSFIVSYRDYQDLQKDINKIKNILAALDQKEQLLEVINRKLANKIDILIGNEIECSAMDGCSLVVSRYGSKKGTSGRIAILGPTRMNYNKAVSTIEYFSELMEELI
jgi:transcriptional regulator of heat shock response